MVKRIKSVYILVLTLLASLCFLLSLNFGLSTVKANTVDAPVFTVNGAYFRMPTETENFYGIRFEFGITEQTHKTLADQGEVFYGMEIYAKGESTPQEVSTKSITPVFDKDGNGYIQGSLVKLQKENLTRPFSAKAYYIIGDGEKNYSEQTNEISIFTMSTMALASGNYSAYENVLNEIVDSVLDVNAQGHYVKNEFKVEVPEGKTLQTLSNGDVITVDSTLKNSANGNVLPVATNVYIVNADGTAMRPENVLKRVDGTLNKYQVSFAYPCEFKIKVALNSVIETFEAKVPVKEGNLVVADIGEGGYYYNQDNNTDFVKAVSYDANEDALKLDLYTENTFRLSVFKVTFDQGLDLENYGGIKINFKVLSHPFGDEADVGLSFVGNGYTQGYDGKIGYGKVATLNTWETLTLSSGDLDAYVDDGATAIILDVERFTERVAGESKNGTIELLLGDIYYYKALETPTNLAINDQNVLTWNEVDNASGYVVKFNDTEKEVATTSLDLTDLIAEATGAISVSVKALSDSDRFITSDYSQAILKFNEPDGVIASYNDKAYAGMIESLGETNSLASATFLPASETDGHDGAVEFAIAKSNGGAIVMFNLILPDALDLTTNTNGIKVRLRVKETNAVATESGGPITTLNLYAAKTTFTANQEFSVRDSQTNAFSFGTMTVGGEWVEFTLVGDNLTNYAYANANGKATLSLGIGYKGQNMRSGTTTIQIDYVKYVQQEKIEESANVIASFNSAEYLNTIQSIGSSTISATSFLPANDEHDGAVQIEFTKGGSGMICAFNLNLSSAIDYSKATTGIKARIRIVSTTGVIGAGVTTLNLSLADHAGDSGKEWSIRNTGYKFGEATIGGDWTELTISKAELSKATAYLNDGDTVLSLAVSQVDCTLRDGKTIIQIDYIEYV